MSGRLFLLTGRSADDNYRNRPPFHTSDLETVTDPGLQTQWRYHDSNLQASGGNPFQVMAHDWSGGRAASDGAESERLNVDWPKAQPPAAQSQVTILTSQPQIVTMPADLDVGVLTPVEQVRRAKVLQSILIGVVLFLWALGTYGQKWQGTWAELSTVFFGALGLDITLDALQSRLKPK